GAHAYQLHGACLAARVGVAGQAGGAAAQHQSAQGNTGNQNQGSTHGVLRIGQRNCSPQEDAFSPGARRHFQTTGVFARVAAFSAGSVPWTTSSSSSPRPAACTSTGGWWCACAAGPIATWRCHWPRATRPSGSTCWPGWRRRPGNTPGPDGESQGGQDATLAADEPADPHGGRKSADPCRRAINAERWPPDEAANQTVTVPENSADHPCISTTARWWAIVPD